MNSPEISKILFIRTDRMGDVLMNLPATRLLRQSFPKSWISLLLDESLRGLLDDHPDIDECLYFSRKKFESSFSYRWEWVRKLGRIRFDLVIISNPSKWLHALSFFAGIPNRIGLDRKWGFFLTKKVRDDKDKNIRHEIDSNLRLAMLVAKENWDKTLLIPINVFAKKNISEKISRLGLTDKSIIAVHPGTSNIQKKWPADRFAKLCQLIESKPNQKVILIGGAEEKETSVEVSKSSKLNLIDWTGMLSLQELVAFLASPNVKALVSSDSGPVHIAWMNRTPVLAMYAKNCPGSDPNRWGPRDAKAQIIFKNMDDITVNEVSAKLDEILESK